MGAEWAKYLRLNAGDAAYYDIANWEERLSQTDLLKFRECAMRILAKEREQEKVLLTFVVDDGLDCQVELLMAPVVNAYGLVASVVGILRDRTQELLRLTDADKKLLNEQSLTEKRSGFYSELAHQLRTPMTMMGSAITLAEARIKLKESAPEKLLGYIEQMKGAVSMMRDISDQTLSLVDVKRSRELVRQGYRIHLAQLAEESLHVELKRRRKPAELADAFFIHIPAHVKADGQKDYWVAVFRQMVILGLIEHNLLRRCLILVDTLNSQLKATFNFHSMPVWLERFREMNADRLEASKAVRIVPEANGLSFEITMIRLIFRGLSSDIEWLANFEPPVLVLTVPIKLDNNIPVVL